MINYNRKTHDRDYFYKYVTADVAKIILDTLQVKCSSPLLFNDPFDSQIEIQHDVKDSEDFINRSTNAIHKLLQPFFKNRDPDKADNMVFNEIKQDSNFVLERKKAFDRFYPEINKMCLEFAKEDRIFCVSEEKDNLLMWAHYSDEHKGAVIKFRCTQEKDTGLYTGLCAAKPVIYSATVPLLTIEDFFSKGERAAIKEYLLNGILLTKSTDWAYEKEWREILSKQQNGQDYDLRGVFEDELDSIYFGCRMEKKEKEEIMDIVKHKRKNMKVFQSQKNVKEFKLDFERLRY